MRDVIRGRTRFEGAEPEGAPVAEDPSVPGAARPSSSPGAAGPAAAGGVEAPAEGSEGQAGPGPAAPGQAGASRQSRAKAGCDPLNPLICETVRDQQTGALIDCCMNCYHGGGWSCRAR